MFPIRTILKRRSSFELRRCLSSTWVWIGVMRDVCFEGDLRWFVYYFVQPPTFMISSKIFVAKSPEKIWRTNVSQLKIMISNYENIDRESALLKFWETYESSRCSWHRYWWWNGKWLPRVVMWLIVGDRLANRRYICKQSHNMCIRLIVEQFCFDSTMDYLVLDLLCDNHEFSV